MLCITRKLAALVVLSMLLTTAVSAAAFETLFPTRLVRRSDSPLSVKDPRRKDMRGEYAEFVGQLWVSGTLHAMWEPQIEDRQPIYWISVDKASAKKLPHFNRWRLHQVDVINGAVALKMAVGAEIVKRLQSKKLRSVEAAGSFLIDHYDIGIDCDSAWARARVVQAKIPNSEDIKIQSVGHCIG